MICCKKFYIHSLILLKTLYGNIIAPPLKIMQTEAQRV